MLSVTTNFNQVNNLPSGCLFTLSCWVKFRTEEGFCIWEMKRPLVPKTLINKLEDEDKFFFFNIICLWQHQRQTSKCMLHQMTYSCLDWVTWPWKLGGTWVFRWLARQHRCLDSGVACHRATRTRVWPCVLSPCRGGPPLQNEMAPFNFLSASNFAPTWPWDLGRK